MSIKERKQNENKRLRQMILDAALRVFAGQGYDKVSMRKIAALIDYSPTTIYQFFKNKEELLQNIAAAVFGDLSEEFERVKAEDGGDPADTLKSLVRGYLIYCVEHPDMFRLFSDLASFELDGSVMHERLGEARYPVFQSWFAYIRRSVAAGAFTIEDERRIFLYLWDSVNGYILHRIRHARIPRKPLADDSAEYLGLLFRGIEMKKDHETLKGVSR